MKDTLLFAQMDEMMVVLKDIAIVECLVGPMADQKAEMMDSPAVLLAVHWD